MLTPDMCLEVRRLTLLGQSPRKITDSITKPTVLMAVDIVHAPRTDPPDRTEAIMNEVEKVAAFPADPTELQEYLLNASIMRRHYKKLWELLKEDGWMVQEMEDWVQVMMERS